MTGLLLISLPRPVLARRGLVGSNLAPDEKVLRPYAEQWMPCRRKNGSKSRRLFGEEMAVIVRSCVSGDCPVVIPLKMADGIAEVREDLK